MSKLIVNAEEWRNDYNTSLQKVCAHLWQGVVEAASHLENDKGEKLSINAGDLSNMTTQVAQQWRRDTQDAEQKG